MIHTEPATEAHVYELLPVMREADWREVEASSRFPVGVTLIMSVMRGGARTGWIDGELAAIGGVVSQGETGIPWMLGTDVIEKKPIEFLRYSREAMSEWVRDYSYMFNYVDARNTVSIRWLKWLGFNLREAEPYGPHDLPFHKFEWRR